MRLTLTVLFFALAWTTVAQAQSDSFNPYEAIVRGLSIDEVEPLITATYGAIEGDYSGFAQPYDGGPMRILEVGSGREYAMFLFCEGILVAFNAPLTPRVAAEILGPLTIAGMESSTHPNAEGVTIFAVNDQLQVGYVGIGTKTSRIIAAYPATAIYRLDYKGLCPAAAD